jgi:hypothetical protein
MFKHHTTKNYTIILVETRSTSTVDTLQYVQNALLRAPRLSTGVCLRYIMQSRKKMKNFGVKGRNGSVEQIGEDRLKERSSTMRNLCKHGNDT